MRAAREPETRQESASVPRNVVLVGDALATLQGLPDGCVSLVCTSPPYWSLRDYHVPPTAWHADPTCAHEWDDYTEAHEERESAISGKTRTTERYYGDESRRFDGNHQRHSAGALCRRCGAYLCPLGMEPMPDCDEAGRAAACGRCYVCHLVEVFHDLRRVLRTDGTAWLNLGDAYAGSWGNYAPRGITGTQRERHDGGERWERRAYDNTTWKPPAAALSNRAAHSSIKNKDLLMLPHRVALALQRDGWWVRQDNVWAKRNCMPESVTDRTTRSHEYVFQLAKSERYFYDAEAVREQHAAPFRKSGPNALRGQVEIRPRGNLQTVDEQSYHPAGRNARSVWQIATRPFAEAHFATFPTELVERCVLAGTSPRVCEHCGTPWQRVTSRELVDAGTWSERAGKKRGQAEGERDRLRANGTVFSDSSVFNSGKVSARHTTGWEPACRCSGSAGRGRALVLDPFGGAGTVGLVARLTGRDYVLIELNPAYARMAERRIARFGRPLRAQPVEPGMPTLWGEEVAGNE